MNEIYTTELLGLGTALAELAVKGTATAVSSKIRAIKEEKNVEKIRNTYEEESKMKKTGIGILACMVLLSLAGCGKMDDTSVQNFSDTKDAFVESEIDLAENNNEHSNKNEDSLYSSDISNYQIFTEANSEAPLKNLYYNIDEFIDSDSSDAVVKGNIAEIEYVYIDGCAYSKLTVDVEEVYQGEVQETITVYEDGGYTRLSDEKAQIEEHVDLSQYTEEEMDNLLMKQYKSPSGAGETNRCRKR